MSKKCLFIFGTRPEAIKMAPLIKEFYKHKNIFDIKICVTAQHREMLDQVMSFFDLKADYDFDLMKSNQTLFDITKNALKGLEYVLNDFLPELVFVQGDTTTAFVGALAAFYKKIPVAHVEAGLRSGNLYSPYPEEANRLMTGRISQIHFAPTDTAKQNLLTENIRENIFVVGNTVVDALFWGLEIINNNTEEPYLKYFDFLDHAKRLILVTGHRRESFGRPFEDMCWAFKEIAEKNKNVEIVYPVHLNPKVREPVNRILKDCTNIHLIEPLDYPYLIWLMKRSYMVLTDSGGIQEEAPSLGKPVLVMRDVTERMEGVNAGTALLVGTSSEKIAHEALLLLDTHAKYNKMAKAVNPYGDGTTSAEIAKLIAKQELNKSF
jgi:UDP-N-acetylglucosamine 2-epimerase (non-hydrolysing)